MEIDKKIKLANLLKSVAIYGLLIIGFIVFIFALISGSEDYGGGLLGILKNSPNALPWGILLVLVFLARKWEFIGGIIISLFGLALIYFFNFRGPNFFLITFMLTLVVTLLGCLLILSAYLKRK